jgi:peroxidase
MMSLHRQNRSRHTASSRKPSHCHTARFDLEQLETRTFLSAAVESVTGTGNNLANTVWGSAGSDLIRLAAAAYANGVNTPALSNNLSARSISNTLNNQADPNDPAQDLATIDQNSLSDYGYAFGQFMDHDLDLTLDGGAAFNIPVAAGDPIGPNAMPFTRSQTDPLSGTGTSNPLEQVTVVTSYFDLSQVYGSSQVVADALRTFSGGLMKTSAGNMLPYDNSTYFTPEQITALNMANDAHLVSTDQLFAAGDRRANENIELTAIQTLFVRNHNQLASRLQNSHPDWTDEQIYQEARKLNIAQYQSIVYNEWIPAVLGINALPTYGGYKTNVDATISTEFSTVAFRFGHSLLSANIGRETNQATPIFDVSKAGTEISLAQAFFNPNLLNPSGVVDPLTGHTSSDIGPLLKAMADGVSQANDLLAVGDIRNLLFGPLGAGGEDLMARDIQRARDHGITDYNSLRVAMGLPAVTSFAQITSDVKVQQELAAAYPGGVNTIDPFEGGLAEGHVAGSDVGPLFQAIMVDQFTRLRDGDRFFYLNENLNADERQILQQGNTLAEVISANTPITNLQADVFLFKASISGTVTVGTGRSGSLLDPGRFRSRGSMEMPGYTVQLEDAAGVVLATTTTDSQGHYSFNQLSGPSSDPLVGSGVSAVGTYQVVLVMTAGMTAASPTTMAVTINRGGVNVRGMNFYVGTSNSGPSDPGWWHSGGEWGRWKQ